jgi:hypothetical protein
VVMKMRSSSKGEPRQLGNVVLLTLMLRSIIALSLIMGWFAPIGRYCSPLLLDLPLDWHDLMTRGGCFSYQWRRRHRTGGRGGNGGQQQGAASSTSIYILFFFASSRIRLGGILRWCYYCSFSLLSRFVLDPPPRPRIHFTPET